MRLHIEKIIRTKLKKLIDNDKFENSNILDAFNNTLNITCFYFNQIPSRRISKDEFYKSLNKIKDEILSDNFSKSYSCNFENFIFFRDFDIANDNYRALEKPSKKRRRIYDLHSLNDGIVFKLKLNTILNKLFVNNEKVEFNDITDALIAESYLQYIKEHNEDAIFITFDTNFRKSLSHVNNDTIQKSITYIQNMLDNDIY